VTPLHHVQTDSKATIGELVLNLNGAHTPTGWVTIEELLRFLIHDLGVPAKTDWPEIVSEGEDRFFEDFARKRKFWPLRLVGETPGGRPEQVRHPKRLASWMRCLLPSCIRSLSAAAVSGLALAKLSLAIDRVSRKLGDPPEYALLLDLVAEHHGSPPARQGLPHADAR
jgi:hypothetical protein